MILSSDILASRIAETAGDLSAGAITTNGGTITLTDSATAKKIALTGALTTTGGGVTAGALVTLSANNMDLTGGTIAAGTTGGATLAPVSTTTAIQVGAGAADAATITLGLTDAELNKITTGGLLTIGSAANTGGI